MAATAAAALVAVATVVSPATQLYTVATPAVRPATMVGTQVPVAPMHTGRFAASQPSTALMAEAQPGAELMQMQHSTTSPTMAGGWAAIGAGMALIGVAVAHVFGRGVKAPTPMYSVSAIEEPTMALMATSGFKAPPADLTLHVYDHCPYCTRVELFLGWNGIKYNRVLYGYGDMEGPKKLTGKKQLPVLQGSGVYNPPNMVGLPESMDIIAWCAQEYGCVLPVATGRSDIAAWQKTAKAPIAALSRPRMIKMPYPDFALEADLEYALNKWAKKTGFVTEEALAQTPELIAEMEKLLWDLEPLLKGNESANPWGLGMDDILLLPDLRRLTCVYGLKWPPKVKNYVDNALNFPAMQCVSYEKWSF